MVKQLRSRQRGAVLVVGLVTLTVMTLMVISMLKTSVLELKIGGANHVSQEVFANAEMALTLFINSSPVFSSNCLADEGLASDCFFKVPPATPNAAIVTTNPGTGAGRVATISNLQGGGSVSLTAMQQGNCIDPPKNGLCSAGDPNCTKIVIFDVRAVSTGAVSGRTIVHQGVATGTLAGSC